MLKIGIKAQRCSLYGVSRPIEWDGNIKNWYQIHGFNTDLGWAMLLVNNTKVSE
jgi:hypothetical protein